MQATAFCPVPRTAPSRVALHSVQRTSSTPRLHGPETQEIDISSAAPDASFGGVRFRSEGSIRRLKATWRGLSGEIIRAVRREHFESEYCGPFHLLIAYEGMARQQGESLIEGVQCSALRDLSEKLILVPAGHRFREWHELRVLGRVIYLYVDARSPVLDAEAGVTSGDLAPRLLFDNPALWQTVLKLASLIEAGSPPSSQYAEALGVVLTHELLRLDGGTAASKPAARGGLAGWQQRVVQEYIEAHLAEQVPLAKLAELTGLSRFHLSRAFKQSFGTPPHRFHMSRRIECAKMLLSKPTLSVTDIALAVGFSETSSFTTAFRKLAGRTPTEYRRSLL